MSEPTPSHLGYQERLLPAWWVWLVALSFAAMLGVAYGAALGSRAGWVVGVALTALMIAMIWITSPQVRVDDTGLAVAGARLPRSAIGAARAVTSDELRSPTGPQSDARLFTALRSWASSDAVLVDVNDPDDPHPAWLFTSRHPGRVVSALTGTM